LEGVVDLKRIGWSWFGGALIAVMLAACSGASTPSASPRQAASPEAGGSPSAAVSAVATPATSPAGGAATHDEFNVLLCDSFRAMFRAVGNPDTGSHSDMLKALDAAIARRDAAAADSASAAVLAELARGRASAAGAAMWPPGAALAGAENSVLAAYEAGVRAETAVAAQGPAAATPAMQLAFEAAGGVQAWRSMLTAASTRSPTPGEKPMRCGDDVPVTLP
jgi:hypothetical protein